MAYVDKNNKVIILYPHKTGTHTLRQILADQGRVTGVTPEDHKTNHPSLDQIIAWVPDLGDVHEYQVYAFYREPVEKFISWMAYKYGIYPEMEPTNTVMEFVSNYGYCVPQVRWLKHDTVNINLLDYRNFDFELRRVLGLCGIPTNVSIPVLNASSNKRDRSSFTTEELEYLRELFAADYEFFQSQGITFQ